MKTGPLKMNLLAAGASLICAFGLWNSALCRTVDEHVCFPPSSQNLCVTVCHCHRRRGRDAGRHCEEGRDFSPRRVGELLSRGDIWHLAGRPRASDHMTRALVAQQTQEIQHTHGIFFFPSEGKRGGDPATKQMAAVTAAAAAER